METVKTHLVLPKVGDSRDRKQQQEQKKKHCFKTFRENEVIS